MFEAVIFDWDGTLADTRRAVVASFQKALREMHVQISDEFIARLIGIGSAETFREILRQAKVPFDEKLIENLVKQKINAEIEMSNGVRLFEGSLELLQSLQGKIKMGLASMNNRDVIDHMIKVMKIRGFFDAVLTVEDVTNPKPDPEIFLRCARKLKSSPDKCVVVEDSIFGVKAAKTARMRCIAVLTGVYSREELQEAKPDLIVNSLKEKNLVLSFILR
jgi:HAD superfamily hydrolase (TIGR01509 family)